MTTATMGLREDRPERPEGFMGFQDRYVTRTALSLTLYAMLFFVLAFLSPYVGPALTLLGEATWQERQVAAGQLLFLHETVWTAMPVFFFGSLLFGLLLTKRVAGPLAHLERCAVEWRNGYVAHRLELLPADRLEHLTTATNAAWSQVESSLKSIQQHNQDLRRVADSLVVTLASQSGGAPDAVERVRRIAEASGAIKGALQPFHLTITN